MTLTRKPRSQLTSESTYKYSGAAHCAPVRPPSECFPIWAPRTCRQQNRASIGEASRGSVFLSYNCRLCSRRCREDLFFSFPGVSQILRRAAGCARSPADRLSGPDTMVSRAGYSGKNQRYWGGGQKGEPEGRRDPRGPPLQPLITAVTPDPPKVIPISFHVKPTS